MAFTVVAGWWLVPTLVTLIAFGAALFVCRRDQPAAYGVGAVIDLIFYMGAALVSLIAWLAWAVLT